MIILTNGLAKIADEGFLKVAVNIISRLKESRSDIKIVSYERKSDITDEFIEPNKFMSDKSVKNACKGHDRVLYVPFPTKKWVMALRTYIISKFTKKLSVMLVLKTPISALGKKLLKKSGADIIVFSRDAADFYSDIVGKERVTYMKTGVDTEKFIPVSKERSRELKIKYGFDPDKKIVLHVGHMNEGRNIRLLTGLDEKYEALLVTSTLTRSEADPELKKALLSRGNTRIMDDYVAQIEEIYQLADVYLFPVTESGRCIDVPLSCMEAAACGKPIITTKFGEMKELCDVKGIVYLDAFDSDTLNKRVEDALSLDTVETRTAATNYDWQKTVGAFEDYLCKVGAFNE